MQSYRLIPATQRHIACVRNWFETERALLTWGGPGLTLTTDDEAFAQQIKLNSLASFVLLDGDEVVAFGQYYVRLGRHHFGRLAVSPFRRGQGIAYHLLMALADRAGKTQQARGYSLFVFPYNRVALHTYQRCGFKCQAYPEEIPGGLSDCHYMVTECVSFPQQS